MNSPQLGGSAGAPSPRAAARLRAALVATMVAAPPGDGRDGALEGRRERPLDETPRHLSVGPKGDLFVAEAGRGGGGRRRQPGRPRDDSCFGGSAPSRGSASTRARAREEASRSVSCPSSPSHAVEGGAQQTLPRATSSSSWRARLHGRPRRQPRARRSRGTEPFKDMGTLRSGHHRLQARHPHGRHRQARGAREPDPRPGQQPRRFIRHRV